MGNYYWNSSKSENLYCLIIYMLLESSEIFPSAPTHTYAYMPIICTSVPACVQLCVCLHFNLLPLNKCSPKRPGREVAPETRSASA